MAKILESLTTLGLREHFKTTKCFNRAFEKVRVINAEDGKVTVELTVEPEYTNPMGSLHGGFSASLLDTLSTVAVFNKDNSPNASIDMHLNFLNAGNLGDKLLVNAAVSKSGRNLAFVDVDIRNKETGDVLVKGVLTHAKKAKL